MGDLPGSREARASLVGVQRAKPSGRRRPPVHRPPSSARDLCSLTIDSGGYSAYNARQLGETCEQEK